MVVPEFKRAVKINVWFLRAPKTHCASNFKKFGNFQEFPVFFSSYVKYLMCFFCFMYEWPVLQMCCVYSVCPTKLWNVYKDHQIICCWLGTFTCLATQEWHICKQCIFLKSIPYKAYQTLQQTYHTWYTAHYSLLHLHNIFHICPAGQKAHCIWDIDKI